MLYWYLGLVYHLSLFNYHHLAIVFTLMRCNISSSFFLWAVYLYLVTHYSAWWRKELSILCSFSIMNVVITFRYNFFASKWECQNMGGRRKRFSTWWILLWMDVRAIYYLSMFCLYQRCKLLKPMFFDSEGCPFWSIQGCVSH